MKTATMVAWNRPEYFGPVIESLSKNEWYDYKLFIQLEPSEPEILEKMLDICNSIDFVPTNVRVNKSQLGVNFNNYYIIERMIKEGVLIHKNGQTTSNHDGKIIKVSLEME